MVYGRVLLVLFLVVMMTPAAFGEMQAERSVVIHVKAVPGDDASRFFAIARLAIAALDKGYLVTMLFDGDGARVVKLGSWYGGDTTLLDKLDIPDREMDTLAGSLGLSRASTPSNYGDLLRLLRGKGVVLCVSRDMVHHHGITDDIYDNVFIPVDPAGMLEILSRADVYISY